MSPNPANVSLSNLDPISYEIDAGPMPLRGASPDGLRGMLVRNGPNSIIQDPHAHWFFGDGMLGCSGFRMDMRHTEFRSSRRLRAGEHGGHFACDSMQAIRCGATR